MLKGGGDVAIFICQDNLAKETSVRFILLGFSLFSILVMGTQPLLR